MLGKQSQQHQVNLLPAQQAKRSEWIFTVPVCQMPELSAVLLRFLYQSLLLSFSILLAALLPPFLFSQFL